MIRLPPGVLLVASLLALLSACSNDPHPKPWRAKRADGSPWQVRYAALPDDVRTLDPQFCYEQTGRRVLEPIIDTLLEYDPMKTDPYLLKPCILTEIPHGVPNAAGGVDYVCKIKPGIYFHDDPCFTERNGRGRELVATDALYAFQRIADPAVECPVFSTLEEYIAGLHEAYEAAKTSGKFDYETGLKGVEITDRYGFTLHLTKAYPQILYWLAMHFTSPVSREGVTYYDGKTHPDGPNGKMVTREEMKWHPVGQGAYQLLPGPEGYVRGQRIRLIRADAMRDPKRWGSEPIPKYISATFPTEGWPPEREALDRPLAGKPLPFIDEVNFTIFREMLPNFLLTRQGYQDGMGVNKDSYSSVVTTSKELSPEYKARGMTLDKDVDVSTFFMVFNTEDPLLKNKKLRQAISAAFDRQSYIDNFLTGVPTVAEQLLPPGIQGFRSDLKNPYGFDLEKAKRLLAEAGYPRGIDPATGQPLVLTLEIVSSGAEERQIAEFEQRQFQLLGIRMNVSENNFPKMMERQDKGTFQIASGSGWGADYPDAENFFFLFYSKNVPPVGKNAGRYNNPEFDKLFEQMSAMEDSPARREIIDKMNTIFLEDCPVILTFNKAYFTVGQPWAPRTHSNQMLEGGIKYLVIDSELREQKRKEWNRKPIWPVFLSLACLAGLVGYGISWSKKRNV